MLRTRARRLAAVVVGAAALVSVTALPAQAKTSSPEKWGAAFCGGLTDWSNEITQAGTEISSSVANGTTPAEGKTIIVGFIGGMHDSTDAFYATVKKAGNPDTDNGAKIQKAILKGIAGIGSQVTQIEQLAQALPTTDPASFKTAVDALGTAFDTVGTPFDNAMSQVAKLDKDDSLSEKIQKVKECKILS